MNDLQTINFESGTVSARELYEKLGIRTQFTHWFDRMCEYGFSEGIEFWSKKAKTSEQGGRPSTDYEISIDMAKEICMIQRSPEGKKVREYLIQLEKAWNTPEQVMARALKMADETINSLKAENRVLIEDNERMKPKEIFADSVSASNSTILVGELAKIIKANGVDTGEKRFFAWLRDKGYLIKRRGTDWNMPTQRSMEMGLFKIKETAINKPDGSTQVSKTVKVTGKGQQYFINKFLS